MLERVIPQDRPVDAIGQGHRAVQESQGKVQPRSPCRLAVTAMGKHRCSRLRPYSQPREINAMAIPTMTSQLSPGQPLSTWKPRSRNGSANTRSMRSSRGIRKGWSAFELEGGDVAVLADLSSDRGGTRGCAGSHFFFLKASFTCLLMAL